MGKACGRGGRNRRRAKNVGADEGKRPAQWKREGEEYAEVDRMLGDRRCECRCTDGKTRVGTICGSMRKRVWIRAGDIVCVSLRGYQDDKCDITYKYTPEEVDILRRDGSLSSLTHPEADLANATASASLYAAADETSAAVADTTDDSQLELEIDFTAI